MKYLNVLFAAGLFLLFFIAPSTAAEYAIGDEVTISGSNLNSDETYLYIQGINKPLQDIPEFYGGYVTTEGSPVYVDENNRWSVSFTLANVFDAGTYTIYASPVPFQYTSGHYAVKDEDLVIGTKQITLHGAGFVSQTPVPVKTSTPVPTIIQTQIPTSLPTETSTPVPTQAAKSAVPLAGILAGLFIALRKRVI